MLIRILLSCLISTTFVQPAKAENSFAYGAAIIAGSATGYDAFHTQYVGKAVARALKSNRVTEKLHDKISQFDAERQDSKIWRYTKAGLKTVYACGIAGAAFWLFKGTHAEIASSDSSSLPQETLPVSLLPKSIPTLSQMALKAVIANPDKCLTSKNLAVPSVTLPAEKMFINGLLNDEIDNGENYTQKLVFNRAIYYLVREKFYCLESLPHLAKELGITEEYLTYGKLEDYVKDVADSCKYADTRLASLEQGAQVGQTHMRIVKPIPQNTKEWIEYCKRYSMPERPKIMNQLKDILADLWAYQMIEKAEKLKKQDIADQRARLLESTSKAVTEEIKNKGLTVEALGKDSLSQSIKNIIVYRAPKYQDVCKEIESNKTPTILSPDLRQLILKNFKQYMALENYEQIEIIPLLRVKLN